jgi:hypothetical protein
VVEQRGIEPLTSGLQSPMARFVIGWHPITCEGMWYFFRQKQTIQKRQLKGCGVFLG